MRLFIEITFLVISLGIIIPILVLFIESCLAFLPTISEPKAPKISRPKVVVLVPAHNEAAVIATTLKTLLLELTPEDRLLVIADNCTDDTAAIARLCGATVVERQDLHRRGKGYALDYGLQFIAADPPEVVAVIDADTYVHPHTIERIATLAKSSERPVQATNLLEQPSQYNPKTAVSAFGFMVKNLVRPKGLAQMGLPCLLQGTGMAFPWSLIHKVSLANGNIVEDMQVALDLAIAGHPPLFCPTGKVTGVLPQGDRSAKNQRTRWEHGHLQTLLTQVPRLFKASISQRRFDLLAIVLDLSIPPLSLLVLIWLVFIAIAFLLGILGISWIPATILGISGLLLLFSILGAWAKFARSEFPISTLLAVPVYVLWKIPIYLEFLVRRQIEWVRTERD